MAKLSRFLTVPIVAALIVSACGGGGTPAPSTGGGASTPPASTAPASAGTSGAPGSQAAVGGSLNVLSLWGGSEEAAFKAMLAAFTKKTGIEVKYEADRQTYSTTLQSRITGGNPPDIAIIPGIGFLRRFAKDGSLKKISDLGVDASTLTSDYPEGFLAAGTVDGELYALPAKYNNKGTMWYRPDVYKDNSVDKPT